VRNSPVSIVLGIRPPVMNAMNNFARSVATLNPARIEQCDVIRANHGGRKTNPQVPFAEIVEAKGEGPISARIAAHGFARCANPFNARLVERLFTAMSAIEMMSGVRSAARTLFVRSAARATVNRKVMQRENEYLRW